MADFEFENNAPSEPALSLEDRKKHFQGRCLKFKRKIGEMEFNFNPFVSLSSAIIIWGLIIWALYNKESSAEKIISVQHWISDTFTWLYIATEFGCAIFVVYIYFKFGHLKLGDEKDKPEFNDFSYFCMTFTTGIALEIFYASVENPFMYYVQPDDGLNYWGKSNYINRAQTAINLTLYHWGIHGFGVYTIPGLLIGILTHRKGLPWSMRTCFYPLFGARIFGRLGDLVDIFSIVCIMFGTAVALTFGSELLTSGIKELFLDDCFEIEKIHQVGVIWMLTAIATVSLISGLHMGIKKLSEVCFISGAFVLLVVVFVDKTSFIMNVFVQSFGYYFQFLIGTGFYTSAFEQTGNVPNQQVSTDWMHEQTLFWWGWWISWAPLAGMFIVRVSKGRKLSDVIFYVFILPTFYIIFWISTYGGVAINMENRAIKLNISCQENISCNKSEEILNTTAKLGNATVSLLNTTLKNIHYTSFGKMLQNTTGLVRLSCLESGSDRFFAVIKQYGDISTALSVLAIISIVVFYATSSDSTSLVIDSISSNGDEDPSMTQRIFWALTEGAAGTALVFYGDVKSITPIPVVFSLPLLFILILSCVSLWRVLNKEPNWSIELDRCWNTEYGYIKNINILFKVLIATFAPWYYLSSAMIEFKNINKTSHKIIVYVKFTLPMLLWMCFLISETKVQHINMFGWVILVFWILYCSYLRRKVRIYQNIYGNIIEDIFASCIYPFSVLQIHNEISYIKDLIKKKNSNQEGNHVIENTTFIYDENVLAF